MKSSAAGVLKSVKPNVILALLVLLAAGWFGWRGVQASKVESLGDEAGRVRADVAAKLGERLQAASDRLDATRSRIALATALGRGDTQAANDLITEGWSGVEAVEWHAADLEAAYADPQAFGFGKLRILELALQQNGTQAAVVKDAGGPRLGLAAPVIEDGKVLTLVYVRMPLSALVEPLQTAALEGGYLALRQGQHTVLEQGDAELSKMAEVGAVTIPDTQLRVVAAVPAGDSGLGAGTNYLLAALAGFIGLVLMLLPRLKGLRIQRKGGADEEQDQPTLAQLKEAGALEPAAPAPGNRPASPPPAPRAALDRSIFRAYDIRGVVGKTLDTETARLIGQAIGTVMQQQDARSIVVGRDGRLSSPQMAEALIDGLRRAGREVIDIGEAPTPVVYFGAYHLRAGSCVSVTGSHNPPDYNGFKIVIEGETLAGDAIQKLYERIAENRLHTADSQGLVSRRDISDDYIQRIAGDIQIERKLRVVVDCGSGIAGAIAPRLLEAIGADVEPLFCEVDGTFPHHHPDPSDPHNLQDLINVVKRVDADLGLAFDGDGDRLGVVTKSGEMIYPDRLLMLFAADVLERNPGACVIYDVKCTGHLSMHILRHGGSPLMWKTGHSLIKAKMRETEAELAGEMSGHFFFRERWYGFDDGIYAAARLLEILSSRGETPQEVFDTLPKGVSTPELKIQVEEGQQYAFIEKFLAEAKFEGARIATIDGLRADWPDGWGLVRASNTTPVLVLRFDAKDTAALERIKETFRRQLLAVDPGLALPF
ncbi:phosphomannomutase/phosphoglucomutase [Arenimonas terrae]|jgi:phosphomannomutase/phosphoglucomutase|uniref:phosphomannomutase n=1 Tax=Arenimonas terrae TaxID=2546226 RepID=A0A5C4RPA2_9GAMM|nr:phosphomannomutase/phosphoglucomutase [Arenimonas terrae]TNJ32774.1 phosphomannomutase/phosphoglucomutase [Arenimonas terrae]